MIVLGSPKSRCEMGWLAHVLHKPETRMRLEVSLPPAEVVQRFSREMAVVRSAVWSPALLRSERFVGQVGERAVRMRVRHGYTNGFTRILSGQFDVTELGTRIDLRFRTLRWVELIMRAVWAALLVPSILFVSGALQTAPSDWRAVNLALAGPAVTLILIFAIEAFGRRLGDGDEREMREQIDRWFTDVRSG